MDEKSVRAIQSLASRSGEAAGPATPRGTPTRPLKESSSCPICGGSGWKDASQGHERRVKRCECVLKNQEEHLKSASAIPARYAGCEFENYRTDFNAGLAAAKITLEKWAEQYPLDRTGLLLVGPSGVGKTHLSVAAMRRLIEKGIPCLFCDYRELLKRIQNSYNPSVQATELEVLKPIFETEVVLLDDLGAVKPSEWVWDTVSLILNSRYNDNRTTMITSNYLDGPSAAADGVEGARRASREETLGDRIGERMRSRLFEMCRLVQLDGRDYRLRFRTALAR